MSDFTLGNFTLVNLTLFIFPNLGQLQGIIPGVIRLNDLTLVNFTLGNCSKCSATMGYDTMHNFNERFYPGLLTDMGEAMGRSKNTFVINLLIYSLTDSLIFCEIILTEPPRSDG